MADAKDNQDTVAEPVRTMIASKVLRSVGIFLIVYLMLIGPLEFIFSRLGLGSDGSAGTILRAIYMPVIKLHENSDAFKRVLDWYIGLFL